MQPYNELLKKILVEGESREDRTGVGTQSVFGEMLKFNFFQGFPILTTRKIHFKSITEELLWFLRGETNVRELQKRGVTIWDEWADENGELGPVYGKQWRSWTTEKGVFDQIQDAVHQIKTNPQSRRILVSAWNVADLSEMKLPPCHLLFQFFVRKGQFLDCLVTQRSADVFLGLPFNISSYALLMSLMAHHTGLQAGCLSFSIGDAHIYKNHQEQVKELLSRPLFRYNLPKLHIQPTIKSDLGDYEFEKDFWLVDYQHYPHIRAEVAV